MERRACNRKIEVRCNGDGADMVRCAAGYAAVFHRQGDAGTEFDMGQGVRERILPGAFDGAILNDDVRALYNHNPDHLLGRKSAGTLRIATDGEGLRYEIDLPNSPMGDAVAVAMQRGDLTGSSFSFDATDVTWREEEDDSGQRVAIREVRGAKLYDVGPVTFPAYEGTSAAMRSLVTEFETWKRSQLPLAARLAQYRSRAIHASDY